MKQSLLPTLLLSLITALVSPVRADETKGPNRWNKDMAAFAKRDAGTAPPQDALLFTGSSSIRMWDLGTSWPDDRTINNGFGGSTFPDVIAHFERLVPPYDARAVIVYSGDNDIKLGHSAAEVIANVKAVHALIAAAKPGVPVIFIAIKPSSSRWTLWPVMKEVNEAMASLEGTLEDFYYADIASPMLPENGEAPGAEWFKKDGLHLSPEGYAAWTAVVNETLKRAGVLK
jgi:lysophospholipase L1-like esterase